MSAVFDCIASLNDVAPMFPMLLSVDLREWKSDFVDEYIFYLQETVKVFFFLLVYQLTVYHPRDLRREVGGNSTQASQATLVLFLMLYYIGRVG